MKVRKDNVFTKEPRWVPTQEYLDTLEWKRKCHRLTNPLPERRQPSPYAEERDRLRRFKHNNLLEGIREVNDPKWRPRILPSQKALCPRLQNRKRKASKYIKLYIQPSLEVHYALVELGWVSKTPNVRRRTKRQEMRHWIHTMHRGIGDGVSCKERRFKKRKTEGKQWKGFTKKVA